MRKMMCSDAGSLPHDSGLWPAIARPAKGSWKSMPVHLLNEGEIPFTLQ
jgi:hypothetical protein